MLVHTQPSRVPSRSLQNDLQSGSCSNCGMVHVATHFCRQESVSHAGKRAFVSSHTLAYSDSRHSNEFHSSKRAKTQLLDYENEVVSLRDELHDGEGTSDLVLLDMPSVGNSSWNYSPVPSPLSASSPPSSPSSGVPFDDHDDDFSGCLLDASILGPTFQQTTLWSAVPMLSSSNDYIRESTSSESDEDDLSSASCAVYSSTVGEGSIAIFNVPESTSVEDWYAEKPCSETNSDSETKAAPEKKDTNEVTPTAPKVIEISIAENDSVKSPRTRKSKRKRLSSSPKRVQYSEPSSLKGKDCDVVTQTVMLMTGSAMKEYFVNHEVLTLKHSEEDEDEIIDIGDSFDC